MPAQKYLNKEVGFTLIELLIVIVIITILIMFLFVSFTQVQKNSRDAQRKSDLQTVAGALQRFYSDNSQYPKVSSGKISYYLPNCTDSTGTLTTSAWGTGAITCTSSGNSKTYIKQLPKDPTGTNQYCYTSADAQHYILYAAMEGKGNLTSNVNCGGSSGTPYNYQVTSQD